MVYPKPIMSVTELTELGFPRDYLMRIVHARGQQFAFHMDGKKKSNSKWLFVTDEFEKWRSKQ